jgi:hypothetical protein
MVRDDEPVRRDERRAAAAEGHDRSHRLAREIGESLRIASETHRPEALGELRDLLRHPHAFVPASGGRQKTENKDEIETGFQEFLLEKMAAQTSNYALTLSLALVKYSGQR